ncbi:MAG: hypothetical protein DRP01_00840 [Archaeoglobales archaeon]|nr:MAG: hypothetical protein DRP01_00840 [Archaeoglobales archaeon]
MRKIGLALLVILLINIYSPLLSLLRVEVPEVKARPGSAPVVLWHGSKSYLSRFIKDEQYVVVFSVYSPGWATDNYIATGQGAIYVYEVLTGEEVLSITPPSGTCEVWDISDINNPTKLWSIKAGTCRSYIDPSESYVLFFAQNGTIWVYTIGGTMLQRFYCNETTYGVGVTRSLEYIVFSGTTADTGNTTVWKGTPSGGYSVYARLQVGHVRRVVITDDGKYLVLARYDAPYCYIYENTGTGFELKYTIENPTGDGFGALAATNDLSVIALGAASDGWMYVYSWDGTSAQLITSKQGPEAVRIYAPFGLESGFGLDYAKARRFVAFSPPGKTWGFIVDIESKEWFEITYTDTSNGAVISPSGAYAYVGTALCTFIYPDPQSGLPRLRLEGHIEMEDLCWASDKGFPLIMPQKDYHIYIKDLEIKVKKLELLPEHQLVTPPELEKGIIQGQPAFPLAGEADPAILPLFGSKLGYWDTVTISRYPTTTTVKGDYVITGSPPSGFTPGFLGIEYQIPLAPVPIDKIDEMDITVLLTPRYEEAIAGRKMNNYLDMLVAAGFTGAAFTAVWATGQYLLRPTGEVYVELIGLKGELIQEGVVKRSDLAKLIEDWTDALSALREEMKKVSTKTLRGMREYMEMAKMKAQMERNIEYLKARFGKIRWKFYELGKKLNAKIDFKYSVVGRLVKVGTLKAIGAGVGAFLATTTAFGAGEFLFKNIYGRVGFQRIPVLLRGYKITVPGKAPSVFLLGVMAEDKVIYSDPVWGTMKVRDYLTQIFTKYYEALGWNAYIRWKTAKTSDLDSVLKAVEEAYKVSPKDFIKECLGGVYPAEASVEELVMVTGLVILYSSNFLEWFWGFFKGWPKETIEISDECGGISAVVKISRRETITNPEEISKMLDITMKYEKSKLMDEEVRPDYVLYRGSFGDVNGSSGVVLYANISAPALITCDLKGSLWVKKDLTEVYNGTLWTEFHFDYRYDLHLSRVELVDLPFEPKAIVKVSYPKSSTERMRIVQIPLDYWNITTIGNITNMILLSPAYFDPFDGKIIQRCEKFEILVAKDVAAVPDASIILLLDGGNATDIPRVLSVTIGSFVYDQSITYNLTLAVYFKTPGGTLKPVDVKVITETVDVEANSTRTMTYDISSLIDETIQLAENYEYAKFVASGKIVSAEYNYNPANDYDEVEWEPETFVTPPAKEGIVRIEVVDVFTRDPISGAEVSIWSSPDQSDLQSDTTDGGYVEFTVYGNRSYTVRVEKDGYLPAQETFYIYSLPMTYRVYMWPETIPPVPPPPGSNMTEPPPAEGYYVLGVQVLWNDGVPFHGANVTVYEGTTKLASLLTNGTGYVYFYLTPNKTYTVTINATNPNNTTQTWSTQFDVYLDACYLFVRKVPWNSVGIVYRTLHVYVKDAINRTAIERALVHLEMINGAYDLYNTTDANGHCSFNIPMYEVYNVTAYKSGYYNASQTIFFLNESVPLIIYLYPKSTDGVCVEIIEPPPNSNYTHAPYPVKLCNGTILMVLAVQTIFNTSAPFSNATVEIYDQSGNLMMSDITNGTGFAYFWIKNGTVVDIKISATWKGESYTTWRNDTLVDRCLWIQEVMPWESPWHEAEVRVMYIEWPIHKGIGSALHTLIWGIWTNEPQTITVLLRIVRNDTGEVVWSKSIDVDLNAYEFHNFTFVDLNITDFTYVYADINIISYQYDTNLENNYLRTELIKLRPPIDLDVALYVYVEEWGRGGTVYPGETVVRVDVGIRSIYCKLLDKFTRLVVKGQYYDVLEEHKNKTFRLFDKNITVEKVKERVWYNFTFVVPWTRGEIVFNATVFHPEEDYFGIGNIQLSAIYVPPHITLEKVLDFPKILEEGKEYEVKLQIITNNRPGLYTGVEIWFLNKTAEYYNFTIDEGRKVYTIKFKAPERKSIFEFELPFGIWKWKLKTVTEDVDCIVTVFGYDIYDGDNSQEFRGLKLTGTYMDWVWLILVIIGIILVIGIIIAILRIIFVVKEEKPYKYVTEHEISKKDKYVSEDEKEYKYVENGQ